jgi:hypothetical protein
MNLGHHHVFQQPTKIAQVTLLSQMGSGRFAEVICVVCEISGICVRSWNSRDARPSTDMLAIPRLRASRSARNDMLYPDLGRVPR